MKTKNVTHQIKHLGDCMTCFILSVFYGSGMHRIIGSPFYVNKYFSLLESSMYIVFSIRLFVFSTLVFLLYVQYLLFLFFSPYLYSYLFLSFSLSMCMCVCVSHHAMHYSSVQSFKVTVAFMVQGR